MHLENPAVDVMISVMAPSVSCMRLYSSDSKMIIEVTSSVERFSVISIEWLKYLFLL